MSYVKCVKFLMGLSLLVLGANGKIFDYVEPCHYKDDACLLNSAKKCLPYVAKGDPRLGIPSADPLVLSDVVGDIGKLLLRFKGLSVVGCSKCKIIKIIRPTKLEAVLIIECPIAASGHYFVGGHLLDLPIDGEGPFKLETKSIRITVTITLKVIKGKDGEDHYKISKFDYEYEPVEQVHYQLDNLCGGDEAKAAPFHAILNDKESGKELLKTFGQSVVVELIKKAVIIVDKWFYAAPCKEIEL